MVNPVHQATPPPARTAAVSRPDTARWDENAFRARRDACLAAVRVAVARRVRVGAGGEVSFTVPDPGKFLWHHVFALLEADPTGETKVPGHDLTVRRLVRALVRYPNVFHFNADGPALCLMRYPRIIAPEDRRYLFEGHERSVLNHPDQPNYDLFTGEGTENHVAMSRFAGYLLCQDWLRDHPDDARARRGLALSREYILRHARDVYRAGTGEFNSSTYYGYQMRGMLTCYEFARDKTVRDACRALLDHFAAESAVKYVQGVNAGPESRGGDDRSLKSEMNQMLWLWFGGAAPAAPPPTEPTNAVYAALSSYRPPALLGPVARKAGTGGGSYRNSHPSYLLDRPAASRETLFFGDGWAMGCLYLAAAGFTGATQQFRPAKLVVATRTGESAWTLFANSDSRTEDGGGRGPYDQWAHHEDTLIQVTDVPADAAARATAADAITEEWRAGWRASYQRRFGPRADVDIHGPTRATVRAADLKSCVVFPDPAVWGGEIVTERVGAGETVFLRVEDVYIAVRTLRAPAPGRDVRPDGKLRLFDPIGAGQTGGLVLEVGTKARDGSFADFRAAVARETRLDTSRLAADGRVRYRNRRGTRLDVRVSRAAPPGGFRELIFDWGYIDAAADDVPRPLMTVPPFRQPLYPFGAGVPAVTVNGEPLGGPGFLDPSAPWPVFDGPNLTQSGGVMTIRAGGASYVVDFAGASPKWRQGR